MSLQSGEATVVAVIPWLKARSFVRFALGWSYADRGAPYRLRRENPQRHPRFSWLTASTVSFSAVSPVGVEDVGTKVAGAFASVLPVGKYDTIFATVRFVDRPWTFLVDNDVRRTTEDTRNTYFDPVPSVEIISAEGLNNIKFANGPNRSTPIPAPFGTLMSKMLLTFNWMWVPNEFISGSDPLRFTPTKILNCVGRVNSDTFRGYPPGTLLLQAPAFERFRFPMLAANGVDGYFGWNVRLPIQYFDPDRGADSASLTTRTSGTAGVITIGNAPAKAISYSTSSTVNVTWSTGSRTGMTVSSVTATTITVTGGAGDDFPAAGSLVFTNDDGYRGHQLVPNRADLFWYGAKRENGDAKLYPEAAYAQMFTHVDS